MTDIRDLLEQGAGGDAAGFTTADVAARVRRRRVSRQAGAAILGTLILVAGAVGLWTVLDRPDEVQVSTDPGPATPDEPDRTEHGSDGPHAPEQATFEVLFTGPSQGGHIGMLGSATDDDALGTLWEAFGLVGGDGHAAVPMPDVDFDRQVVVAVIIPDDACPPELIRFDVDGSALTPVFVQPLGGCVDPLIPKVYVVALTHELAPPGSILRYPDDRELQSLREGPTEIPIWPEGEPTTTEVAVEVHFTPDDWGAPDCAVTTPVARTVSVEGPVTTARRMEAALNALLAGPTVDEMATGLTSWFSADTAGMVRTVTVVDGVARVDFDNFARLLNNASTSCGSTSLISSLDGTVTQFGGVNAAVYSFEGEVEAFYHWLQRVPPNARSSEAAWELFLESRLGEVVLVSPEFTGTDGPTRVVARAVDGRRIVDVAAFDGGDWRAVTTIDLPPPGYPFAADLPLQYADVTGDGRPDVLIMLEAAQSIGVVISSHGGDWRALPVEQRDVSVDQPYLGVNPRIEDGILVADERTCEPSCAAGDMHRRVWQFHEGRLRPIR